MKRLLTITFLLVALAPLTHGADDQAKKKKKSKKAQTEQTANGGRATATQTNRYSDKVRSNAGTSRNYSGERQRDQTNVPGQRTNVVNRNVQVNSRTQVNSNVHVNRRRFVITGNRVSFNDARRYNWRQRHDRGWWLGHNYRVVRYGGGYWFWNNGWWYPAYGFDPFYSRYVYDGPIFGFGYVSPGDVTAEVQRALASRGYYYGPIDGILGPGTRGAIERYQANRGLYVTAAIDEPTLTSLGLT